MLLSAQQIKNWDAYTITHEPVTSIDLMERAAGECVKWIKKSVDEGKDIYIFCGKGNNGGDGLAIARLLFENGYHVSVFINGAHNKWSNDAFVNFERLRQTPVVYKIMEGGDALPVIPPGTVIVDALFGSGLNRPLSGFDEELVKCINAAPAKVIAIDVPSGMPVDSSCKNNTVIKATHTLTFQLCKQCLLVAENAGSFGEVSVLDIGLDKKYLNTIDTRLKIVTAAQISGMIRPRNPFSHKGSFGHAMLAAGNYGKAGAAVLAAKACLRTGAGLLTVALPDQLAAIMNTALPEAMTTGRAMTGLQKYSAVGVGPGIGVDEEATTMVEQVVSGFTKPMIADADALTILSKNKNWLAKMPAGSIVTPHPKEFDRLLGESENDFERVEKAMAFTKQYPLVMVLKGHYTLIAYDGLGWYNTTGNAGLAKGGSGDVLTGMLTALLAQGYDPLDAALLGVYLHGLSADIASATIATESMLATDVIDNISAAFKKIQSR